MVVRKKGGREYLPSLGGEEWGESVLQLDFGDFGLILRAFNVKDWTEVPNGQYSGVHTYLGRVWRSIEFEAGDGSCGMSCWVWLVS